MKKNKGLTLFISIVVLLVLIVIVIGFVLIGSPNSQRLERLDSQRSNNLSSIDAELIDYWVLEKEFPESLEAIKPQMYDQDNLQDPETQEYYAYSRISENTFELCATFALAEEDERRYPQPRFEYTTRSGSYYQHEAGENCYEVTIDPESYDDFVNRDPSLPTDFPVRAY